MLDFVENVPYIRNPFNSFLNAAKSSYRINEIKELFSFISEKLNGIRNNSYTGNCENLIFSSIFKKWILIFYIFYFKIKNIWKNYYIFVYDIIKNGKI